MLQKNDSALEEALKTYGEAIQELEHFIGAIELLELLKTTDTVVKKRAGNAELLPELEVLPEFDRPHAPLPVHRFIREKSYTGLQHCRIPDSCGLVSRPPPGR
jgi:hypothetical protein